MQVPLQTGAPEGVVAVSIVSYSEDGGAMQSPLSLPMPLNASRNSTRSSSGRRLLQQVPFADVTAQVVCQGCNDSRAMQAALTSATPAALFNTYTTANGKHSHPYYILQCVMMVQPTTVTAVAWSSLLQDDTLASLIRALCMSFQGCCVVYPMSFIISPFAMHS